MKISEVFKNFKYVLIALFSSIVLASIYIYSQVLGIWQNVDLWFKVIPNYNLILFAVFVLLFGITVSYQIYIWRQKRICSIKGIGTGSSATFTSFLIAQCPACASLGAFFLPLSVISFFARYGFYINLFSIVLLLFTLRYLGAFKKQ